MPLRTLEAQDGILRMSSEVRFTLSIHSFCPADRSLFVPAALISRERFNSRLLDDQRFSCLVAYFSVIGKNPARGFIVTIGKHQTQILFLIFAVFLRLVSNALSAPFGAASSMPQLGISNQFGDMCGCVRNADNRLIYHRWGRLASSERKSFLMSLRPEHA
jgi:hypothetical protein